MKQIRHKYGYTALTAIVVAAVTAGGPVIAGTIADFARNADKVDGRHAVGARASLETRAKKLVATNKNGRLPNNIIRKAPAARDADRVGGFGPTAFVRGCQAGALRGQAQVPTTVGAEFERVSGFSTIYGGPVDLDGNNCHLDEARARRVATGTYDVRLALVAWTCTEPMPADIITALVSIQSAQPLVATYEPVCDSNSVYVRVRIADLNGTFVDAPFSVALLDENGIPIP
ncbi:MAG: hypothetical protein ACRDLB_12695 [Actinomycetota bacterium]